MAQPHQASSAFAVPTPSLLEETQCVTHNLEPNISHGL